MMTFIYDGSSEIERYIDELNRMGIFPYRVKAESPDGRKVVFIVSKTERGKIVIKRYILRSSEKQRKIRELMKIANREYSKLSEKTREVVSKNDFVGWYIANKADEMNQIPSHVELKPNALFKTLSSLKTIGGVQIVEGKGSIE